MGRRVVPRRPELSALEAAAVAVVALEAQALLEPVDLGPKRRELAAGDAVAGGALQLTLDRIGLAAQADRLALRDDPAVDRTLDAVLDPLEVAAQLVDRLARRAAAISLGVAAVAAMVAAMAGILGRGRSDGEDGAGAAN